MTALTIPQMRVYPPDGTVIDQPTFRQIHDETFARVGGVPYDVSAYPGQVLAVALDGSPATVAELIGFGPVRFGRQGVAQFRPHVVAVTSGPVVLTDAVHLGARLAFSNASNVTVTIAISGSPATGISDNFWCQLARLNGSLAVQWSLSGLTNGHRATHTRVMDRGIVEVWVYNGVAYFNGATEA